MMVFKWNLLFQGGITRFHVKLWQGIMTIKHPPKFTCGTQPKVRSGMVHQLIILKTLQKKALQVAILVAKLCNIEFYKSFTKKPMKHLQCWPVLPESRWLISSTTRQIVSSMMSRHFSMSGPSLSYRKGQMANGN